MKFRVTLTDPAANVFVLPEFSGMVEGYLSLERHKEFHTIQEFYNATLHAFGKNLQIDGAREWLKGAESNLGADAIISTLIEVDFKFTGVFETMYNGIVAVGLFIETLQDDHLLQLTISQSAWWQKFLKRLDSQINVQSNGDVEGNAATPMNYKPITLTAQKINKSYIAYRSKNAVISINQITNPVFLVGFDSETLKEIELQSAFDASVISGGTNAIYPNPEKVVPFWNLLDDGNLVLNNILLTMSLGGVTSDPNHVGGADFINAKNNKCIALDNFDLYIQKNDEQPVKFSKVNRAVPTSFVRNDGVVENLVTGFSGAAEVTDFTLPKDFSLKVTKYDAVRIYMLDSTIAFPPVTDADGMIFLWGQDGWDHNSGFDQCKDGQGCFMKRVAPSAHYPANRDNLAYGGIWNASLNVFPTFIDDDAGLAQMIKAGNFWNISDDAPGILGGVPVTGVNVIRAKVDNPANILADWDISVKTPYEGLENYAFASTSFQGYYDPASGNFPTHEKDGISAIKFIDRWFITSLNTNLQGAYVDSTYIIQALMNAPGNVRANWWISTREFYDNYFLQDLQFQGFWDASVNLYPALRKDGSPIIADDIWIISTGGTFGGGGGIPVDALQVIRAKVNAPGQVNGNWDIYTVEQWQAYAKASYTVFNGIKATFETTYKDSVGQGFLLHDIGTAICDRITGQTGLFYSPLLGNPFTKKYFAAVGGFSLFALFKGLQIRGYDLVEKPFFTSMKEFWNGINNLACLALGKYKIAGNDQIVIKTRAEVYNPAMVVKLNWVQNIKRSYNNEEQYTSVDIGYTTWESKSGSSGSGIPSGIDDVQTEQSRNTLFKNIGKKISIKSDLIAASLTTEATRRISNKQSANYQYDNNIFIVALTSNGDGTFKPELNENFSEIDNLLNSNSRYNIRLSTFRNFLRHLDYLSGCLQNNLASFFRFASGKGNYKMTSKATSNYLGDNTGVLVKENQDVNPSNNPLYLDQQFEIEHYLDWACYKLLRDNPDMAIGISQTDTGHIPFFYDNLKFYFGKGTVSINAKPKSKFDIKTIVDEGGKKKYYEPAYDPHYE